MEEHDKGDGHPLNVRGSLCLKMVNELFRIEKMAEGEEVKVMVCLWNKQN